MSSTLVGHPVDLVKVRVQTMKLAPGELPPGTVNMLKETMKKEGIRGVYRGVSAPMTAIAPIYATCFWGYDMGQRLVRSVYSMPNTGDGSQFTLAQTCFAGGFSAIPTTALMAPSERIKCLLQVQAGQAGPPKYSGMLDCGMQVSPGGAKGSLATCESPCPHVNPFLTSFCLLALQGGRHPKRIPRHGRHSNARRPRFHSVVRRLRDR